MTQRIEVNGKRYYRHPETGRLAPSVSQIVWDVTADSLTKWGARMAANFVLDHINDRVSKTTLRDAAILQPEAAMKTAADIGTLTHELAWSQNRPTDLPKEVESALISWDWFLQESGAILIAEEQEVLGFLDDNDTIGYGGTYDAIIQMPDSRRVLIDIKTSRQIHNAYALQLSAYHHLVKDQVDETWVVHINKFYPRYDIYEVDTKIGFELFAAAHRIYTRMNGSLWR